MKKFILILTVLCSLMTDYQIAFGNQDKKLQYRISAILVRSETEAKLILKKLSDGDDFAKLATEFSIGLGKEQGGDLGYFSFGDMIPELEDEVKKLKIGKYSGIISTTQGYFIVRKTDEKNESEVENILNSQKSSHIQSLNRMQTLQNEGMRLYEIYNFYGAAQKWEEGLKIARMAENKQYISDFINNLGILYWGFGDYSKALSYYQQALEIDRAVNNKNGAGVTLYNIGIIYMDIGNYSAALSYFEEALKIHKEMGNKNRIGSDFTGLGGVYTRLGDYTKAIINFEEAIKIKKAIGDIKEEGSNLNNIGLVYGCLGDYATALSYFEQALKISEETGDKRSAAIALNNIAEVYSVYGDYSIALNYYQKAMEIIEKIGAPTGIVKANMADIWLKIGETVKAEKVLLQLSEFTRLGNLNLVKQNYEKAIECYNKSLQDNLQICDAEFLFAIYTGRGCAFEGMKDFFKARENFEKAINIVEQSREVLDQEERSRFFVTELQSFGRIMPYEGMVRVLLANNNQTQALFYAESLKARLLSEAIAIGHAMQEYRLPSEVVEQEKYFATQIIGLRKQMEALYKNNAMDTYYEKEKELNTVKARQQQFITHLKKQYPEYASINYPQPIHANEVILNLNELLIEFEVTETTTHVFFLRDGELKTRTINVTRDSLEKMVVDYRGFFEGITKTTQLGKYDPKRGEQLFDLLFGGALNSITEVTSLIIVPDEFLGILPFEALVVAIPDEEKYRESEFGPFPLGVTYLADKYLISYAQSATSLTLLRTLKKGMGTGEDMLVVADPIFSGNDSRLQALAHSEVSDEKLNLMGAIVDWKQMGVKGLRSKDEQRDIPFDVDAIFPRLEKTSFLAQRLQSDFGDKAIVISGNEAKEDKVRAMDFNQYRYITFATHGILDRTVPYIQEPALVLTQVGNPEGYDGFLTMSEVMGLKLDAKVVALTACETGLGKNVSGEGVMGMGRAFQYAGARNVLVSLWSVAETSATGLTSAFFKYIKAGEKPKQALRLVRNEIRHQGYEHPFYWASFILFGK